MNSITTKDGEMEFFRVDNFEEYKKLLEQEHYDGPEYEVAYHEDYEALKPKEYPAIIYLSQDRDGVGNINIMTVQDIVRLYEISVGRRF